MHTPAELRAEIRSIGALSAADLGVRLNAMPLDHLRILARAAGMGVPDRWDAAKIAARAVPVFRQHHENVVITGEIIDAAFARMAAA